ncbi:MAG: presqualene diphosphate synthase HpnD [Burkholderiaceae bacterium]|jgi:phytoene synthase|nr:squalene synthase HpnD [Candidatus Fonsibacter lacus]
MSAYDTPQQYVQAKAAASGSSFYYAFMFLPPARRAAITAFYAFCREVDDIVDEVHDPSVAQTKLAWWRTEVQRLADGQPSHPVTQALQPHVVPLGIPLHALWGVIDGCQQDLQQTRYATFSDLQGYAHLVAGLVGEAAAHIFGQTQAATTTYAHTLGQALQLTNIIRDVGEDARRGRVYLPQQDMQTYGVTDNDLLAAQTSPALAKLLAFEAQRALALYDQALAALPEADRRAQKPGLMMASIYRHLLLSMQAEGFGVLQRRVTMTPLRKLWLAWRVQALGWVW